MGLGDVCAVDDLVAFLNWGLSVRDDVGSAVDLSRGPQVGPRAQRGEAEG